uniref:Uncharacterized protein n=1 Tax=Glossina morsitans morsitans TaxID=37546 RepID=A0A240SX04_GLOMM
MTCNSTNINGNNNNNNNKLKKQLENKSKQQPSQYLNVDSDLTLVVSKKQNASSLDKKQTSNLDVTEDPHQFAVAPTLPAHSPHSPVHINLDALQPQNQSLPNQQQNQQQQKQQQQQQQPSNKLSARYINNNKTSLEYSSRKSANNRIKTGEDSIHKQHEEHKTIASSHDIEKTSGPRGATSSPSSSSKLICSCEKLLKIEPILTPVAIKDRASGTRDSKQRAQPNANATTKRLILTRNAATSPNLDLRKLNILTTLTASTNGQKNKSKEKKEQEQNPCSEKGECFKNSLEKSNSLGESKKPKQLRTTRSLSPRPPMRHQHAIIVSEVNDTEEYELKKPITTTITTGRTEIDNEFNVNSPHVYREQMILRHRKVQNACRSEQSSPNVIEGSNLKFAYREQTNRSTGCLVYIPSDPWLKKNDNVKRPLILAKTINQTLPENTLDPWVKRNDTPLGRTPKQELFRQAKSFSATRFEVEPTQTGSMVQSTTNQHSSLMRSSKEKYTSISDIYKPLQSAPSSPHFLCAPDNPFSSVYSLNTPYGNEKQQIEQLQQEIDNTPMRSSSFSPGRVKDCLNPFLDVANVPNSPPPLISVAAENSNGKNQKLQNEIYTQSNHSFLNICNPNLLQARHSFSSSPEKQVEEELQLNIRRLSDQMRRKAGLPCNNLKTINKPFSSDRNVNRSQDGGENVYRERENGRPNPITNKPTYRADFSDYLEQFRCSEAKKAASAAALKENKIMWSKTDAMAPIMPPPEVSESKDSLLETTC